MFSFLKAIGVMKLLCALVSLTPDQEILNLAHTFKYSLHEVINRKLILVS